MSDRQARAAFSAAIAARQRLVSCVTRSVLVQGVTPLGKRACSLAGEVARLRGAHGLGLVVIEEFDVEAGDGRSGVLTVGYRYEFRHADGPMLLAWHWHPVGVSPVTAPHLHLGGSLGGIDLSKAHLPTGPVTLQAALRFAVTDLGVEPLRDDWRDLLAPA